MAQLKLYWVKIVVPVMVLAEDAAEAADTAIHNFEDVTATAVYEELQEVTTADQIPDGWARSIPFYDGDQEIPELTCQQFLEQPVEPDPKPDPRQQPLPL